MRIIADKISAHEPSKEYNIIFKNVQLITSSKAKAGQIKATKQMGMNQNIYSLK